MQGSELFLSITFLIILLLIIYIICRVLKIGIKFRYIYPGLYLFVTLAGCIIMAASGHKGNIFGLVYVSGAPGSLLSFVIIFAFTHDMKAAWWALLLSPLLGILQYIVIGKIFDFISGQIDKNRKP